MNEPHMALMRAAVEAVQPHVRSLRERGWPVEVVARADPHSLTLEIDLSGLQVPVESSGEGER